MHRFSWDLHYEPIGDEPRAGGGATGAVPGRTYPRVQAPWAPPGDYTVRLTVDGRSFTQPLSLRLDPRVTTPPEDLALLAKLSREMWEGAHAANRAYEEARALVARLESAGDTETKDRVEALAPRAASGSSRYYSDPSGPPTLNQVSRTLISAAMAMQGADVAPTARQIAACEAAQAELQEVMEMWRALRGSIRSP
jgi:hypothetical protein